MRALSLPLLFVSAVLCATIATPATAQPTTLQVTVDSAKREVVIVAGPFDLKKMVMMPGMPMDHSAGSPMMRFAWPVNAYLHAVDLQFVNASGKPLPREVLHHLVMYNFDRRQLVHESVERLFGYGQDTKAIELPAGVAAPLSLGTHLGFLVVWHNDTGTDIRGAYVRMRMSYLAVKSVKVAGLPFYVDVHNLNGGENSYDLPAGRSSRSFDFTLPVSGRLIAAGGHLHDYGKSVRLVDVATGKVLVKLTSDLDAEGHNRATGRFVFGFNDDALWLDAHHPYRIVADYDNPTGHPIQNGGMSHLNGLFQPSDLALWPKVDPNDPELKKDFAALPPDLGSEADEHAQMQMEMAMPEHQKDSARKP